MQNSFVEKLIKLRDLILLNRGLNLMNSTYTHRITALVIKREIELDRILIKKLAIILTKIN
jgi:hypothetical protein